MEIIWDPVKQVKLKAERGIDLDEIKGLIEDGKYIEILEHRSRPNQVIIVVKYKSYVHLVPAKIDHDRIVIKTCYPNRKMNQKYGGLKNEKNRS